LTDTVDDPRRWRVLCVVSLSQFMTSLMTNAIFIAITPISSAFGRNVDDGQWLLLAYLLALTSFLGLFGRLGDIFGHKHMLVLGFAIMGAFDFASFFAHDFWLLVAFRFVDGIGAAFLQATSSAIITETFPARERGMALGINGAAVAVGWTIGPLIGGTIATFLGWRYIFLISTPIAIFGFAAAILVLRQGAHRAERLDIPGAACSAVSLFALALALSRAHVWGYTSPATLGALVLALLAGIAFIAIEQRVAEPILDLRMFDNRVFAFSALAAVLYFTSLNGILFILPIELQTVVGMTGFNAGLALVPLAGAIILISPFAGWLCDRINPRYLASGGIAVVACGALLLSAIDRSAGVVDIAVRVVIVGIGVGFFNQPNNYAIMTNAPRNRLGTAGAILATARAAGGLLGAALAGAVYFWRASQLGPQGIGSTAPASAVFVGVAALCVAAGIVSYSRGRTGKAAPAT